MSCRGSKVPYVSSIVIRTTGLAITKNKTPLTLSLFKKYSSFFFLPKQVYRLAFYSRHTTVTAFFENNLIRLHRGKLWRGLVCSKLHTGFKLGQFAKTRSLALFRQKATKKKKPTKTSTNTNLVNELRINKITQIKTGEKKKPMGTFNSQFEAQFNAL